MHSGVSEDSNAGVIKISKTTRANYKLAEMILLIFYSCFAAYDILI